MSSHYFIGIPVSSPIRSLLKEWKNQLKEDLPYGVWTHELDFHITLKFLGGVEEDKLQVLKNKLEDIDVPAFELNIGTVGHFGNPRQPRVIWADVDRHKYLLNLQKQVESLCEDVGFQVEKRQYNPHVTLAKKWKGKKELEQDFEALYNHMDKMEQMIVDHFTLFKIHPNSEQKYEAVQQYPLQGMDKVE